MKKVYYKIRKVVWDCDCRPTYYDYGKPWYDTYEEAKFECEKSTDFLEIYTVNYELCELN